MNFLKSPWFWVAVVIIIGIWLVGAYNSFVTLNESIDTQWAQVETQYQRRFDLIPNLVNSVQGIFTQEQEVFRAIADARSRYQGAQSTDEKAQSATQLEGALGRLLVIVEAYPQLNSYQNVIQLMDELAGTENRVAVERGRYNTLVRDYNVAVKRFPGNILAGTFGFEEKAFFEAQQGAEQAPEVDFNN